MHPSLAGIFPAYTDFAPRVPVHCVTPGGTGYIHRYYDSSPFSPSGRYLTSFGKSGVAPEQVGSLRRPCNDTAGNLLIPDQKSASGTLHRIAWFRGDGAFLRGFGTYGSATGQFSYPEGVPASHRIAVGIALGYPDSEAPANAFRTEREPLEKFVRWVE